MSLLLTGITRAIPSCTIAIPKASSLSIPVTLTICAYTKLGVPKASPELILEGSNMIAPLIIKGAPRASKELIEEGCNICEPIIVATPKASKLVMPVAPSTWLRFIIVGLPKASVLAMPVTINDTPPPLIPFRGTPDCNLPTPEVAMLHDSVALVAPALFDAARFI